MSGPEPEIEIEAEIEVEIAETSEETRCDLDHANDPAEASATS